MLRHDIMHHYTHYLLCSLLLITQGCAIIDGLVEDEPGQDEGDMSTSKNTSPDMIRAPDMPLKPVLSVTSSMPEQGATQITYANRTITLSFDQEVNADAIRNSVEISSDTAPSPNFALEARGTTLLITPQDIQEFETRYIITIKQGAPSINGHALREDFELQFTTARVFEAWYYTLHNENLGPDVVLQSSEPSNPISMSPRIAGDNAQHWQFIPSITAGYYQLATRDFPNRSVEGARGEIPAFSTEYGRSTGEQWTIVPSGRENLWTLQNLNHTDTRALEGGDGTTNVLPLMETLSKDQDLIVSGQLWTLTRTTRAF